MKKTNEAAIFPVSTEAEIAEYISYISDKIPADFSGEEGPGLPEIKIPNGSVQLPGLVIITSFTSGGYQFRTGERINEYNEYVQRNIQLTLNGRGHEIVFWEDPEYSHDELAALLIRYKNDVFTEEAGQKEYYIHVFVELDISKEKMIEFLGLLKRLKIVYKISF